MAILITCSNILSLFLETIDKSRQIQVLLAQIEGVDIKEISNLSRSQVITADQIITEKLSTFRNIQELQQKNEQLLATIRSLSAEREREEKQHLSQIEEAQKFF